MASSSPPTIHEISENPPPNALAAPDFLTRLRGAAALLVPTGLNTLTDQCEAARFTVRRVHRREHGYQLVRPDDYWTARSLTERVFHPDTSEPVPWGFRPPALVLFNALTVSAVAVAHSWYGPAKAKYAITAGATAIAAYQLGFTSSNMPQAFPESRTLMTHAPLMGWDLSRIDPPSRVPVAQAAILVAGGLSLFTGHRICHTLARCAARRPRDAGIPFAAILADALAGTTAAITATVGVEWPMVRSGLRVYDAATKEELAMPSTAAARHAVVLTCASRAVFTFSTITGASLLGITILRRSGFVKDLIRQGRMVEPAIAAIAMAAVQAAAFPVSLALFPTRVSLDASTLEPLFRAVNEGSPKPVETVMFYRGI
jgi:hypothetical protein